MGRPVVHFEMGCRDRAKTGDFYARLFGWQITAAGPASNIQTGSTEGIGGHITLAWARARSITLMFYVDVEDVRVALDQAIELGGKALVGPITIPAGTFAWFADPDGNTVGLLTPARPPA